MTLGMVLAIFFTAGWIPLYLSRAEDVGEALPAYESREKLVMVATVVVLSLHMATGCLLVSLRADIGPGRGALAAAVYAFGIGFWFWGRRLIGPLKVRRRPDQPPLRFRRDGAFGIVRHPLYFGCLVAMAAPVVVTLSPWLTVSYACCGLVLGVRAVQEETRLRAQVGAQYDAYRNEVKRLIPYVW